MAMLQFAYERQILMGVNREGWIPPLQVSSPTRILETLYADPEAAARSPCESRTVSACYFKRIQPNSSASGA